MADLTPEQLALLSLHLVSGIGRRTVANLLERFGSAAAALQAPARDLAQIPYVGDGKATSFRAALDQLDVTGELARLRQHDVHLRFLGEPDYPAALAAIPDPPHVLFVAGTVEPCDARAVAIVGSRQCTPYGKRVAGRLAADLARAGWTVVSGLARGIDACAHRGALEAGGRTIAVLAGGLASVYPPEHRELAAEVRRSGAYLSESHMCMESLPVLFPGRNRIISGLSQAVVIVEANARSGALHTKTHALEQGREVFAVPGPVDSPASEGTLQLLRDGARVVRNADDVLADLQGLAPVARPPEGDTAAPPAVEARPAEPPPGLDETQRLVWDVLTEPRHQDQLVQDLGIGVAQLSGTLLMLEMKKVVRRLPGNRYERW